MRLAQGEDDPLDMQEQEACLKERRALLGSLFYVGLPFRAVHFNNPVLLLLFFDSSKPVSGFDVTLETYRAFSSETVERKSLLLSGFGRLPTQAALYFLSRSAAK